MMVNLAQRQDSGSLEPTFSPEYLAFNNAHQILSIAGTFTGLAIAVVLARLYVRTIMLRVVGSDDCIIIISLLLSIGVLITKVGQTHHGLGRHFATWSAEDFAQYEVWMFAQSLLIVTGISSVKVSVGLSLARLWKGTRYIKFIWTVIIFTVLFCLACNGTLIFQCIPVDASWDFSLRPPPIGTGTAKCFSLNTFRNIGLFNSITNIITDVIFATIPIPLIWQLQLNTRTKISLIAILSLGYFASGAATVKAIKQWSFFTDTDWSVHDAFNVWNIIEFNTGIVAACLPSLRPLFNWFLDTARAITTGNNSSRSRNHNGYGYGSGYANSSFKRASSLSYFKQVVEAGIEMDSMPSREEFPATGPYRNSPYNVRVSGGKDNDFSSEGKGSSSSDRAKRSDDSILPLQRPEGGIIRTTEVTIS